MKWPVRPQAVAGDDRQRQATLIAQLVDNVLTLFFETPALAGCHTVRAA